MLLRSDPSKFINRIGQIFNIIGDLRLEAVDWVLATGATSIDASSHFGGDVRFHGDLIRFDDIFHWNRISSSV